MSVAVQNGLSLTLSKSLKFCFLASMAKFREREREKERDTVATKHNCNNKTVLWSANNKQTLMECKSLSLV